MPKGQEDVLYPVTIVGGGISAFSTAYHLLDQGLSELLIIGRREDGMSGRSPGYVCGGTWENFSRPCHAHGVELAAKLWSFGDLAFQSLREYCKNNQIGWHEAKRYRFLVSQAELIEAKKALIHLDGLGFGCKLRETKELSYPFQQEVLAVQDDGNRSAFVKVESLMSSLSGALKAQTLEKYVTEIRDDGSCFSVRCEDGSTYRSELVILACHDRIPKLLNSLAPAFVPVADQYAWYSGSLGGGKPGDSASSMLFSSQHCYDWGGLASDGTIFKGGGRYLRKGAGVGAVKAEYKQMIEEHSLKRLKSLFGSKCNFNIDKSGKAGLEIYPCDELPIIGPALGSGRVLVASGYSNQGLSFGFQAGKSLADLVLHGQSCQLPRDFWPERFRSL